VQQQLGKLGILSDIELRFGPTQKKAAELARLIPQFIPIGGFDDEEWSQLQKAVKVDSDLLPDSMATVQGEYRL